jgi:hypothetical protein
LAATGVAREGESVGFAINNVLFRFRKREAHETACFANGAQALMEGEDPTPFVFDGTKAFAIVTKDPGILLWFARFVEGDRDHPAAQALASLLKRPVGTELGRDQRERQDAGAFRAALLLHRTLAGEDFASGPKVDVFEGEEGTQETGELFGLLFVFFGVEQVEMDGAQALGFDFDPAGEGFADASRLMLGEGIDTGEPKETVVRLGAGLGVAVEREFDGGRLLGSQRDGAAELAELGLGALVIELGVEKAEDFAEVGAAVLVEALADGVDRFAVLGAKALENAGEGATGGVSVQHG